MKDIGNLTQLCYTQQSLNAFENCPLKFKKRYLEGLRWDSLPDEAARTSLDRGNSFHLLACRYFSGIPLGLSENAVDFELLAKWMRNLESSFKIRPEAVYLPEHTMRARLDGFLLEANLDLLIIEDGQLKIWDWKTHVSKNSGLSSNISIMRSRLEKSLQTMVYMYVLKEQAASAAGGLPGGTPISMSYWQPDSPHIIAEIKYDAGTHESFRFYLLQLLKRISGFDFSNFDKSLYSKHCKRCEFNWYCNGIATK